MAVKKKKFLPLPDHEYGYTSRFLDSFLNKTEQKKFGKWIYGQTCMRDKKTNQPVFYTHDVKAFIDMIWHKRPDRQKNWMLWD